MRRIIRLIRNSLHRQRGKRNIVADTLKQTKPHHLLIVSIAIFAISAVLFFTMPNTIAQAAEQPTDKALDTANIAAQSSSADIIAGADVSEAASLQAAEEIIAAAAAPTASPAPTPVPDPTLQKGDENERVQKLQERLMDLNFLDLDESTQLYGPATEYAVQLFQRQLGLKQDGIAGPATLDLIYSDEAQEYTLLKGTYGSDVDSLQRQLVDLGYLDTATGYYGSETVAAVVAFQERNGLDVDGKTGEQTLSLIYSPNAEKSAAKVQAEARSANIATFLDVAEAQLGDPYIFGSVGPDSFDCSGLVYYCLQQAGSSLGRYNAAGYSQVDDWEKITSMDDLQKGDILFFSTNGKKVGHTGIYIGNGEMIDASSSNGEVVKRSCVSSFWKANFVVARRPL